MTERISYAPGTPSWIDLGSPDTAATAAFYGALFGWRSRWTPGPKRAATAFSRSAARTWPGSDRR